MAVSKVILNGNTLMDVTQDTVAADNLLQTYTATKNDGTKVTGTYVPQTCVLQSKTVSPSTSQQTVSPDSGYDGLSSVTVNAMPSGSATTPATTITANPTISVSASGLITASVSKTQDVTPSVSAGYVSSGTAGTVTVNGSNTQQLTVYNGAHHSVIAIISFTIGSNSSYQAQDGMTWGEWVESEYNTGGFYANGGYVFADASHYISNSDLTNVINADQRYIISTYGGGN